MLSRFSLTAVSGGYSLVACESFSLRWLLIAENGFSPRSPRLQELGHVGSAAAAPGLYSTGSTVVAYGLSCPKACGSSWIRD